MRRNFDHLVFSVAVQIPSKEIAKEIFDSSNGKDFIIDDPTLTALA
jgi:hypothetical protein